MTAKIDARATETSGSLLAGVRAWYDATVDALTRAWEPRFRFRQYRPDEEGDYEDNREAPRDALQQALWRLPVLRGEGTAHLVLAASEQTYDDGIAAIYEAAEVMGDDMLERAEALGYFATDPGALRFPDLPGAGYIDDDIQRAEQDLETAENCDVIMHNAREGVFTDEERAETAAKLASARERVAGIRSGKIPAFTEAQKVARHAALRREIVLAYKGRLQAAGVDASWVEVPPYWREERLAEEARS